MATDKKFEEMMQELEQISQDLEKGDLSLDESMKKFEEGIALSKKCSEILETTKKKKKILIRDENKLKEEDFDVE